MKTKAIYKALLAACLVLTFASCTKDEEQIFDKSAAVRMKEALINAKNILTAAPNGWVMYYYPEGDQIYGGYVHVMKFTEAGEVTVWSELFNNSYTSIFDMLPDDGPVLSFDTNNFAFHYWATPSGSGKNQYGESGLYQAYKGDFEFMIMKATADEVILNGKRTRNKIHMYPISETPDEFMAKIDHMNEQLFVSSFNGTIGNDAVNLYLSLGNRQAKFTLPEQLNEDGEPLKVSVAYSITDRGISLYKPIKVGSNTISEFIFNPETQCLISDNPNASLQGELPEGWHAYNGFVGNYSLTYFDGTITGIEVKADVVGKSYTVSGLSPAFDVVATYDLGLGRIEIQAQYVAGPDETGNGYDVMMAGWDSKAGKVNYTTSGLYGILNEEGNSISWEDNNKFSGYTTDGFILYFFTTSGSRVGVTSAPWIWTGREALDASKQNRAKAWKTFDRL